MRRILIQENRPRPRSRNPLRRRGGRRSGWVQVERFVNNNHPRTRYIENEDEDRCAEDEDAHFFYAVFALARSSPPEKLKLSDAVGVQHENRESADNIAKRDRCEIPEQAPLIPEWHAFGEKSDRDQEPVSLKRTAPAVGAMIHECPSVSVGEDVAHHNLQLLDLGVATDGDFQWGTGTGKAAFFEQGVG